jgi:hypothetical protein
MTSKKERIDEAWRAYLAASHAIPNLSWPDYCEKDTTLFADYIAVERAILAEKESTTKKEAEKGGAP